MKIKNLIIMTAMFFVTCSVMIGQKKSEISVYAGGGLSTLKYDLSTGDSKNKMGGTFGLGYTYFVTNNIGIVSGLELSMFNAKSTMGNISEQYMTKDDEGEEFRFSYTMKGYEEKQNLAYISIPIMVQYQMSPEKGFYGAAGFKIGLPVKKEYKSSASSITSSGYYPNSQVTYDDLEYRGFGTFNNIKHTNDLKVKTAYFLSVEAGYKIPIADNLRLYVGAYFDYGLNDIKKESNSNYFLPYDNENPTDFKSNSMLTGKYQKDSGSKSFTDKVNLMAAGLKIKLAY